MKLFFAPSACSLSPHIALAEAGLTYEIEKVDLTSKLTQSGADYRTINPKGSVPALQLDNGEVLTEGAAIVQYIADQNPSAHLAPPNGSLERYRLQEWLNFIASELHKSFGPFFSPVSSDELKAATKANLGAKFDLVSKSLGAKPYLMGDAFSVADGYLFTVLSWTGWVGIDLGQWPSLKSFCDRVAARPKVQAVRAAEAA